MGFGNIVILYLNGTRIPKGYAKRENGPLFNTTLIERGSNSVALLVSMNLAQQSGAAHGTFSPVDHDRHQHSQNTWVNHVAKEAARVM